MSSDPKETDGGISVSDARDSAEDPSTDIPAAPPKSETPAGGLGLFAAALVFLWPLAYSPALFSPVWGPKWAIAVLVAGVGLPLLWRQRNRAGAAGAVFLGLAVLSTAFSDNPAMSLVGPWNWGTGLFLVASMVGAWALGRALSGSERRLMEKSLIVSVLIVAALALLQMGANLAAFEQALVFGRSTALQGNPVYLGGLLAGGLLLTAHRFARGAMVWAVALAVVAGAMAVAQGRVSLVIAAVTPLAVLRVAGLRRSTVAAAAIAIGWALGVGLTLITSVPTAPGARSEDPAASVAYNTYAVREGMGPRMETWWTSRYAVMERPLLGSGPGRFWAANVPHRTLLSTQYSPVQYYSDPHNIIVEYLTTTGVLGLLALGAWVVLASRTAAGGAGWAAAGLGFVHLLQPQNALLTPLMFLLLGAATHRDSSPRRGALWPVLLGSAIGLTAAGLYLTGQLALRQAYLTFDQESARLASRLLAPWPEAAEREAMVVANAIVEGGQSDWSEVRRLLTTATRRDPADPRWWIRLGGFEQSRRNVAGAERAYRRAIAIEPWSLEGARGMRRVALAKGDSKEADYWGRRILQVLEP